MRIIIAVERPCDCDAVRESMCKCGVQSVAVRERACESGGQSAAVAENHVWLQVICDDDQFKPVIAAITHDRRVKAAFVCADEKSSWIMDLACRSSL
ncbi:MAG: hypothetical protein L0H73_05540 [Nitrococcus sp.]|nr:hypothetical protein [Nitrococcus sp.]